ncbi:hypothetical protein ACS0TY_020472 [Phlomoides rotata]
MFSGGVPEGRGRNLADLLGVRKVGSHAIYLGIPTAVGRSREAVFRELVNRVTKKLKDWKARVLSLAGKVTLVKSVIQAIPTYLMTCFKIPKGILEKIESAIARFLWGQKGEEKRVHWLRWDVLCKPKKKGGFGLRNLGNFNSALLAKQGWRLIQDDQSLLAQVLKARYFPRGNFLTTKRGYGSSYTWKSILEGRRVLEKGLVWVIGDGKSVGILGDPWIYDGGDPYMI